MTCDPQFATVTFLDSNGERGSTFRVPISHETTVRQLAKDAMQRLVLSRRATGSTSASSIAVTKVFVDGCDSQPKAEIFAQDFVTQVVTVKKEVIFMRLRSTADVSKTPAPAPAEAKATAGKFRSLSLPEEKSRAAAPAAPAMPSTTAAIPSQETFTVAAADKSERTRGAAGMKRARQSDDAADVAGEKSSKSSSSAVSPEDAAPKVSRRRQQLPPVDVGDASIERLREREKTRLGWGPEAHKCFASNYVSSPEKLMRRSSNKAKGVVLEAKREEKKDQVEKQRTIPEVEVVDADAEEAEVVAKDLSRLAWGPEAAKCFAPNYVTSPDRLARELRRRKLEAKRGVQQVSTDITAATAAAAHLPPPHKAAVARKLEMDDADSQRRSGETRPTVGHKVVAVQQAEAIKKERPKGWGTEATKYFDPATYCDDPTKAVLSSAERARPIRSRFHRGD